MRDMYDPTKNKNINIDKTTGKRKISDTFHSESKKKRGPGRPPKKSKLVPKIAVKKPRGRPPKTSDSRKNPRGRPPKMTLLDSAKKPRGRPPLNTSGESAEWDEETGTWLDVQEKKKPTKIKSIRSSTIRSSLLLITEAIDEFTQCQAEYTEQHATQMRKMIKGLNNVIDKIND